MNTFFKGKKLLVVGGTSGMGLAVARMVLEAGGSVVLTGNKKDKAYLRLNRPPNAPESVCYRYFGNVRELVFRSLC